MSEKRVWLIVLVIFICILIGLAYAEEPQTESIPLRDKALVSSPPMELAVQTPQWSEKTVSLAKSGFQTSESEPLGPLPASKFTPPTPVPTAHPSVPFPTSSPLLVSQPDSPFDSVLTHYIMNYNRQLSPEQAQLLSNAILQFSDRYKVDYRLVASVIAVESSFRHDAISSSGAIGLGQLKPDTARWLGVVNPFDPVDNLAGATRYISWLVNRYGGDLDKAISAYFQGPGNIDRVGITDGCKTYLEKVNTALNRF